MSEGDPFKNPFRWFMNACLLLLGGMVALSLAVQILSQIWQWVALGIVVVGAAVIGFRIWQERGKPW